MSVHQQIIDHLRIAVAADANPLRIHLDGFDDTEVSHKLFQSFRKRGDDPIGMRLKWLGLQLLSCYFRPYDIPIPEDYVLGSKDLLWLDRRAKMPYYIGRGEESKDSKGGKDTSPIRLVVFDAKLGVYLKLADGMISTLRDMELG